MRWGEGVGSGVRGDMHRVGCRGLGGREGVGQEVECCWGSGVARGASKRPPKAGFAASLL